MAAILENRKRFPSKFFQYFRKFFRWHRVKHIRRFSLVYYDRSCNQFCLDRPKTKNTVKIYYIAVFMLSRDHVTAINTRKLQKKLKIFTLNRRVSGRLSQRAVVCSHVVTGWVVTDKE